MAAYLIRRLLLIIPTLWAIITINFLSCKLHPVARSIRPSPLSKWARAAASAAAEQATAWGMHAPALPVPRTVNTAAPAG